jgi:hypothetical protein
MTVNDDSDFPVHKGNKLLGDAGNKPVVRFQKTVEPFFINSGGNPIPCRCRSTVSEAGCLGRCSESAAE